MRLALCVALTAGISAPALAGMGGGSSTGATTAAAREEMLQLQRLFPIQFRAKVVRNLSQ